MVGSDAVIGFFSGGGGGGGNGSAIADVQFYGLAGQSPSAVGETLIPDVLSDASIESVDGIITMRFSRSLAAGSVPLDSDQVSWLLW